MLVRKYIHRRLQEYYAQPFDRVVGSIAQQQQQTTTTKRLRGAIPFPYLLGEYHWKYLYGNIYRNTAGQWLTPSELFSPYYGNCMALWIIQQIQQQQQSHQDHHERPKKIKIIELGGGRGTNAMDVLNYLHEHHYDNIYTNILSYTILDISKPLLQYQTAVAVPSIHRQIFQNRYVDLYDYVTATTTSTTTQTTVTTTTNQDATVLQHQGIYDNETDGIITIVIGLELLDNLPHDKIRVTKRRRRPLLHDITNNNNNSDTTKRQQQLSSYNVVEQTELMEVDTDGGGGGGSVPTLYKEVFVPVTDALLQHVLQYYPLPVTNNHEKQYFWIPTIACGMIHAILNEQQQQQRCRPDHQNKNTILFLFADFDDFTDVIPKQKKVSPSVSKRSVDAMDPSPVVLPPAMGEPIVTDMNDIDLESYLHRSNTATDILFPTNFHSFATYIAAILQQQTGQETAVTTSDTPVTSLSSISNINNDSGRVPVVVTVQKQSDFLQSVGPQQVRATTSVIFGYSPMIHDFENCSILTVGGSRISSNQKE